MIQSATSTLTNPLLYIGFGILSLSTWFGSLLIVQLGLYFSGHLVFTHVIQHLTANLSFADAQNILLTGVSAGGLGTFMNANWLHEEIMKHAKDPEAVTMKAAPGLYMNECGSCFIDCPALFLINILGSR